MAEHNKEYNVDLRYDTFNDDNLGQDKFKENSDLRNNNGKNPQKPSWKLAEFDDVGQTSRDGSVHATDEVVNSATHLAATMLSFLGSVLLIAEASAQGEPWKIVSMSIYGASLVFLFACSTLHHSVSSSEEVELRLRILDYLAIYPLISGTFTPMCLVFYHDSPVGWCFFGSVWILSIAGMLLTCCFFEKIPKWFSMTMYITLGWLGALMSYWLNKAFGISGMAMFILGGIFYTGGGIIYTLERPNPVPGRFGFHEIWHIAVIMGAATHWMLIYFWVLPYKK